MVFHFNSLNIQHQRDFNYLCLKVVAFLYSPVNFHKLLALHENILKVMDVIILYS